VSDSTKPWHEKLDPLDLVYCHFPAEGALEPAPKPRPALILNIADKSEPQRVEVAYGTSQKTAQKYAGEFELTPRDGKVFQLAGLTEESKFDLRRRVWLPYNDRWFAPKPANPPRTTPKLGTLDLNLNKSVRRRFLAAAEAAGLLDASHPSSDDQAISS
jgi:hypothetical protein